METISDLAEYKLDLIEKVIKNDKKYINNEDLYDDFFNETCKRSLNILKIISSDATLIPYIQKVATTAILNVLKDSGRLRRTKNGFTPTKEVSLDDNYSKANISYENFVIEESPEDIVIKNDILEKIAKSVHTINTEDPEKHYLEIYTLRYKNGLTQREIAAELNLSQSEVSKRLFKLMKKVKSALT